MIKIVIIEDEDLIAKDLADTLREVDASVDIVRILNSVDQAVDFLEINKDFDLIFSDIQLPDGLSFDVFKNVAISVPVIFCTAFDQYALKAFDANGIDYLLKPFNNASVRKALDKYLALKSNFSSFDADLGCLLQKLGQQTPNQPTSIIIHHGDRIIPLELSNIALFFLEDNYVFALTFDLKKHIINQSLEELERAGVPSFFRVNRQYLVSRRAIREASQYFNRKLVLHLTINYQEKILVGKLKYSSFLDWLTRS